MADMLNFYLLQNNLYHLNYDFSDDLILEAIANKDFNNYKKLDIIYLIYFSNRPKKAEYDKEETKIRCELIIDKINNLSIYSYSEDEIIKLKKLYYLNCVVDNLMYTFSQEEIELFINDLNNNVIEQDILKENIFKIFVNEELRLRLLQLCQYNGDIYQKFESIITYHLNEAQKYIDIKRNIMEFLF